MQPARPPDEKIVWLNIMYTFARVVGAIHNSFLARGGKEVAHHCHNEYQYQITNVGATIMIHLSEFVLKYQVTYDSFS